MSKVIALTGRNSGRFKFIEAELALRVRELEKAHFLGDQIENRIKSQVPNVDRILLHYEPVSKEAITIALPVTKDHQYLSEHFGEAPSFLLLTMRNRDACLLEQKFLPNPHCLDGSGKGIRASEWLISQGVDEVVVAKSFAHKGPYYVFADAGVRMRQTDIKELDRIKAWLVNPEAQILPIQEAGLTNQVSS